jgi:hypothetical protein
MPQFDFRSLYGSSPRSRRYATNLLLALFGRNAGPQRPQSPRGPQDFERFQSVTGPPREVRRTTPGYFPDSGPYSPLLSSIPVQGGQQVRPRVGQPTFIPNQSSKPRPIGPVSSYVPPVNNDAWNSEQYSAASAAVPGMGVQRPPPGSGRIIGWNWGQPIYAGQPQPRNPYGL